MSDVFGSLVKQYALGQTADQADWLIGAGHLAAGVHGEALRSMKAPGHRLRRPASLGKDPQPAHMDDYVDTHRRQRRRAHQLRHPQPRLLPRRHGARRATRGRRPGAIWYEALRDPALGTGSSFQRFAEITVRVAQQRHGSASAEAKAVYGGWEKVGVPAPKP